MKTQILFALYCLIIGLIGTLSTYAQEKQIDLKEKSISIKMEKQPLGLVFKYLMENYDIPIGFEESILDRGISDYDFIVNLPATSTHKMENPDGSVKFTTRAERHFKAEQHPITVDAKSEKLEDVLTEIVNQMVNYQWAINDGVVNIFPTRGRDEKFEKLIEINIKKFSLEKGKTVEDITTGIQSLPEFLKFIAENDLHFSGSRNGAAFVLKAQYGRTIGDGMDFSNLTFRDLLNRITKVKKGGWRLRWLGVSKANGKENIDIDI